MFTSEKMVKFLREKYPPGTRIRLVSMEDPYAPVAPGTEGTLVCVDDAGQFQMKWDNGRTLALIPGEDSFTVLPPERSVLKLYMPLTAELYEPDEWGDMPEEAERLTGGELASYEDKIRSALFKNRMQEEQVRGIMYWYRKPDSVNDKVHSVVFDVEQRHGRLWGVAECQISGELSAEELAALKKYISGQASDGGRSNWTAAGSCMSTCGRMKTGASGRNRSGSSLTGTSCLSCALPCCRVRGSSSA